MTITMHPVVGWAWIIVAALVGLVIVTGLLAAICGDEIPGWLEQAGPITVGVTIFSVGVAAVLTITSIIFT